MKRKLNNEFTKLNFPEKRIKKNVNNDNLIQSYLIAIDNKNKKEIETLYEININNNTKKDIVYEMYNENQLNSERLQFIIGNCTRYLTISSPLIKKLMQDNNKELLEILFKNHLKCYDNTFIIKLLNYYRNKIPISNSGICTLITNDKYKISTELNENINQYDSSYYLFNTCESGNEAAVKFLLKHGADITIKDKDNRIALARACESGNLELVKYLVHHGADINNEDNFGYTHIFNACHSGNIGLVKYLVEQGLDISKESNDGYTPLFYACETGNLN